MPAGDLGDDFETVEDGGSEQQGPGQALRLLLDAVGRYGWRKLTFFALVVVLLASEIMTALFLWAVQRPLEQWDDGFTAAGIISLMLATPTIAVSLRLIAHLRDVKIRLQHELARTRVLEARLRQLADIDETTGILNRRAFRARAGALLSYAQRHGLSVSVLALDLDGFKSLNDRRGHPAGDRALREVANILRDIVREHDPIARLGGDEFVIMLQGTDLSNAAIVAERIRDAVATTMGGLTASVGVAAGSGDAKFDDLIVQADRALYVAKHGGRNQVSIEGSLGPRHGEDQILDIKISPT